MGLPVKVDGKQDMDIVWMRELPYPLRFLGEMVHHVNAVFRQKGLDHRMVIEWGVQERDNRQEYEVSLLLDKEVRFMERFVAGGMEQAEIVWGVLATRMQGQILWRGLFGWTINK